jgi:hypothetical protein
MHSHCIQCTLLTDGCTVLNCACCRYVHYVPLPSPDEVETTLAWLRTHDEQAQRIARNAAQAMRMELWHARGDTKGCGGSRTTSARAPPAAAASKEGGETVLPRAYAQLHCVISAEEARELLDHAAAGWKTFSRASARPPAADGDADG